MEKWDTWPVKISSPRHTGQLLEWVRWKTENRIMLVIAIGGNSIAISKDENLKAEDAVAMLTDEMETIALAIRQITNDHSYAIARRRPI